MIMMDFSLHIYGHILVTGEGIMFLIEFGNLIVNFWDMGIVSRFLVFTIVIVCA